MTFTDWLRITLTDPEMSLAFAGLMGLIVGSFLNVVAHRLPRMMESEWLHECHEYLDMPPDANAPAPDNLWTLSRCPHCRHAIRPWENVPVLSYLFLRGKCSACGKSISIRYPLVELIAGLLTLAVIWRYGPSLDSLAACAFVWTLLALALIDLDEQILPDSLVYPLLWGGLALSLLNTELPTHWFDFNRSLPGLFFGPSSAIIGAIAGYLCLWLPAWITSLVLRKEAMGQGDFKLIAAIGAWVGWQGVFQVVAVAVFSALAAFILNRIVSGTGVSRRVPFGPFLALGAVVTLLWGIHFELSI